MSTASTIVFVLSPKTLDESNVAIVVELYRGDKLEASTTLATCPPEQLADTLDRCRHHLRGLGMEDRQASPSSSVPGAAEQLT